MELLSIIVPCFNEEKVILMFHQELTNVLQRLYYPYQILFVNDGSQDNTLQVIKSLTREEPNVNYLSFTRNFGKEAAILAGLRHSAGDLVVVMDADLQDPPELIPQMIEAIKKEGFDSVATRRVSRKGEPLLRSIFAKIFYRIINKMSDSEIVDGARDFRMMTRQMVNSILELNEYHRFSKGLFGWVGYKTKWLEYSNVRRTMGNSKWSFWKLVNYGVEGIVAFTTVPLRISFVFGVLLTLGAFVYMLYLAWKFFSGTPLLSSEFLSFAIFFINGFQMIFIGILGEYLAKTYMEVKSRPKYVIKERTKYQPQINRVNPLRDTQSFTRQLK